LQQVWIHLLFKFVYIFFLCHHLVPNHTNGSNIKNTPTANSTAISKLNFILQLQTTVIITEH
jgi:hypothetical protein